MSPLEERLMLLLVSECVYAVKNLGWWVLKANCCAHDLLCSFLEEMEEAISLWVHWGIGALSKSTNHILMWQQDLETLRVVLEITII